MAQAGLAYAGFCPITTTRLPNGLETETLGVGEVLGQLNAFDYAIQTADGKVYGNNALSISVKEFLSGSGTMTLVSVLKRTMAKILGNNYVNGKTTRSTSDAPIYVKYGHITTDYGDDGSIKYVVEILSKIQYGIPSKNYATKGESMTFNLPSLPFEIMRNANGSWEESEEFDSEPEAIAYWQSALNINNEVNALTIETSPANGATNVETDTAVVLTFSNPISAGSVTLFDGTSIVAAAKQFNTGKTVLTVTPVAALNSETSYSLFLTGFKDAHGQTLADSMVSFETA